MEVLRAVGEEVETAEAAAAALAGEADVAVAADMEKPDLATAPAALLLPGSVEVEFELEQEEEEEAAAEDAAADAAAGAMAAEEEAEAPVEAIDSFAVPVQRYWVQPAAAPQLAWGRDAWEPRAAAVEKLVDVVMIDNDGEE